MYMSGKERQETVFFQESTNFYFLVNTAFPLSLTSFNLKS